MWCSGRVPGVPAVSGRCFPTVLPAAREAGDYLVPIGWGGRGEVGGCELAAASSEGG